MTPPRVLVLRAPGTNCDEETAFAFDRAGARTTRAHVNRLLESPRQLHDYQVLCLPGGFSYGDDIAAGRILGVQLRHHLYDALREFKSQDKLILGICNGFQVLMRSGLLFDRDRADLATLTLNDSGHFEARWVHLRVPETRCIFFRGLTSLYLPVAHAEGKFVAAPTVAAELRGQGRIVVEYATSTGALADAQCYPENPNGSVAGIAGVCDGSGRVCGLMPHPERFIDRLQHPRWARGEAPEVGDGLRVFYNAVEYFR
jgi:phosphoribosylformylglycinamidine synthase